MGNCHEKHHRHECGEHHNDCGCHNEADCGCDIEMEHPLAIWQDAFEDAHYELLVEAMKKKMQLKFGKKIEANAEAVLEYFLSATSVEEMEAKAEEKLYSKLQDLA